MTKCAVRSTNQRMIIITVSQCIDQDRHDIIIFTLPDGKNENAEDNSEVTIPDFYSSRNLRFAGAYWVPSSKKNSSRTYSVE